MSTLRLFIGFDTPADTKTDLAGLRNRLRESGADVRWEPDAKLHCTIKFLGDTRDGLVPVITDALRTIGETHAPFTAIYKGIGCFPDRRDPRIIWSGIENPDGNLNRLCHSIDEAVSRLGFEREKRAFHPHVTLGRVKGRSRLGNLLTLMESITFEGRSTSISELHLVKSELRPSGSEYTILHSIPLVGK
jgi:2'-5' RNA ligase